MNAVVSVFSTSTADLDGISQSGLYVRRPHKKTVNANTHQEHPAS